MTFTCTTCRTERPDCEGGDGETCDFCWLAARTWATMGRNAGNGAMA